MAAGRLPGRGSPAWSQMRLNIFPTVAAVTWLPAAETKNVRRDVPNCVRRCLVAAGQDLGDVAGQRQPATAVSLGPHDVEVPVTQVDVSGAQQAGFPGSHPAGVHQREERDRLPPPRGLSLKRRCGSEEPLDLVPAQQVGVGGHDRGLPPVGQHVGVRVPVDLEPPADVADVGHPRPVAARVGQLLGHPSLDGVAVEDGPAVGGAVGVEPLQIPDPGAAVEAHLLLEREVGVQFRRERAGEAVGAHDRALSGTSSTHSSRRSRSTLM